MSRLRPFDHLQLVQRDPLAVARFRAALSRKAGRGAVLEARVEHEADDSCCQREPWLVTLILLMAVEPAEGDANVRS